MGTAVFTLCMRTSKKHTNPQWTWAVIECDSLCILSIAPGSWQLIGIYSFLNHWWTPQRGWVVRRRWPAEGLAMLRWHGTLVLLTLKMRARMWGKLEAPMQNDKMLLYLCACLYMWVRVRVCLCVHCLHCDCLWVGNVTVLSLLSITVDVKDCQCRDFSPIASVEILCIYIL